MPSVTITLPMTGDEAIDGAVLEPVSFSDILVLIGRPVARKARLVMRTLSIDIAASSCVVEIEGPQEWITRLDSWAAAGPFAIREQVNRVERLPNGTRIVHDERITDAPERFPVVNRKK